MSAWNNTTSGDSFHAENMNGITVSFRFWSYLFLDIGSTLCTVFVLYYLLADRTLRGALHNHIIIILLIIGLIYELTDIPWILYYSYTNVPLVSSPIFYLVWVFIDYAFYSTQIALFAWATIERHILIFHDQWLATERKRLFLHYVPIGAILIYCLIYYSLVYFGPFCENSFDSFVAGGVYIPCVFSKTVLGTWDLLVHQVLPTFIIVIFSMALICRVLWQKRKLNQRMRWRKYRKMTRQLLAISLLYLVFNSPWTFLVFAYQYGLPDDVATGGFSYTIYFYYYVIFLFPFVCCGCIPELHKKLRAKFLWFSTQRRRRVVPTHIISVPHLADQTQQPTNAAH